MVEEEIEVTRKYHYSTRSVHADFRIRNWDKLVVEAEVYGRRVSKISDVFVNVKDSSQIGLILNSTQV